MSIKNLWRNLIAKRSPAGPPPRALAPRDEALDNPYLAARRTWNDHVGGVVSSRQTWQVVGILSLLIALAGVGGVTYIGSQSKFVPYVIAVDKLGQAVAVQQAQRAAPVDQRIIHASVAQFVADARLVTPDIALQKKAIFSVYAYLNPNHPASSKMQEWYGGSPEASPFKRAEKETVSVEVLSVIPQTPDTWQVDWEETTRDRQGVRKGTPARMRALVTVVVVPPTNRTTEEEIRKNPMGILVRDFSWTKQV